MLDSFPAVSVTAAATNCQWTAASNVPLDAGYLREVRQRHGTFGYGAGPPLPQMNLSVAVRIGGLNAEVQFAGGSPGLVSGLLLVNAVVPDAAPAGDAVPGVTLTIAPVSALNPPATAADTTAH
jgi:hypothetical protein